MRRRIAATLTLAFGALSGSCESPTAADPLAGTYTLSGTFTRYQHTVAGTCNGQVYFFYCPVTDTIDVPFVGTLTIPGSRDQNGSLTGVRITVNGQHYEFGGIVYADSAM